MLAGMTYNNEHFVLTADIDLNGAQWTPIKSFSGIFDGGGHTISNYIITIPGSNKGFFETITGENTVVKNLNFSNCEIKFVVEKQLFLLPEKASISNIGILSGNLKDKATITNCHIDNCMIYILPEKKN